MVIIISTRLISFVILGGIRKGVCLPGLLPTRRCPLCDFQNSCGYILKASFTNKDSKRTTALLEALPKGWGYVAVCAHRGLWGGPAVGAIYGLGSHMWPGIKRELDQWDSSLAIRNRETERLALLAAETNGTWLATVRAGHPHEGDRLPLRRLTGGALIPEPPSHKARLFRVLPVYTINISSTIIITNTSSFELAWVGFGFLQQKEPSIK